MMNKPVDTLMDEQQFLNFFTVALQDQSLLGELMAFVDAKDDAAIIKWKSECGYHFNQESLRLGIKNIVNLVAPIVLTER